MESSPREPIKDDVHPKHSAAGAAPVSLAPSPQERIKDNRIPDTGGAIPPAIEPSPRERIHDDRNSSLDSVGNLNHNGWAEVTDEHGNIYYRHLASGHCQTHLPVVAEPSAKPMKNAKSRRSMTHRVPRIDAAEDDAKAIAAREKAYALEALRHESKSMISDYVSEVDRYNHAKPYARRPDNTYPKATCVYCHVNLCHMVFFPCEHKCICDACLEGMHVGKHRRAGQAVSPGEHFPGCPVCQGEVKVMFEHTGREVQDYWTWVYEVKPHLAWSFEHKFKSTASKLAKGIAPGTVVPTNQLMQTTDRSTVKRISLLFNRSASLINDHRPYIVATTAAAPAAPDPNTRRLSCTLM
ncbi:Aste57867_24611 [Aphanomyces stellatus]|uniref:Aste57867_24611 protein n=1 Tax=Aphanomyces stellatus TaxID=120398 RepID=A0A485LQY0_9STRA|nr:hypothetical protein As57867_024533 [Aphanomyces stellatus]VFU01249.1 Aste57867_24611 [Aphanomyces stellatus]